jgi:hypothetical protein
MSMKAQKGVGGIAPIICRARRGGELTLHPGRFNPGKYSISTAEEAEWASGPFGTGWNMGTGDIFRK